MERRRGIALGSVVVAAAVAASTAPAQTPTATEAISISLKVSPAVQTADFGRFVTLSGKVNGGAGATAALGDRTLDLDVVAVAEGYDRPVDIEPITPKANGTFKRKLDIAVNSRIALRAAESSGFTGASRAVRVRWRPLSEVSNFTRDRKLVMEYRVSVPGGIPFSRGSLKIKRGTATRAYFYAGPKKAIPRLGSAKLKSAYEGEAHATLAFPFAKLPPGGGRVYACVKGQPFLGFDPVDRTCGRATTTKIATPPET